MTEKARPDCRCATPNRPTGRESEPLPPYECLTCGGYACEYADPGLTRCDPAICDCFIVDYPESPRALHPEAFVVGFSPAPPAEAIPDRVADAILGLVEHDRAMRTPPAGGEDRG